MWRKYRKCDEKRNGMRMQRTGKEIKENGRCKSTKARNTMKVGKVRSNDN